VDVAGILVDEEGILVVVTPVEVVVVGINRGMVGGDIVVGGDNRIGVDILNRQCRCNNPLI
jgi:hypothetical protein